MVSGCGVLLAMLVLAGPRPALAQRISLGFEGGFRSSRASISPADDALDMNAKTDFTTGPSARFRFGRIVTLRVSARYTSKGFDAGADLFGTPMEMSLDLDYLEFPVLMSASLPSRHRLTPFLTIGPALSFQLGCDVTVLVRGQRASGTCAIDGDDVELETTSTEVGAIFGAGVDVAAGPVTLTFEAGYHLGLKDVASDPDVGLKHRGLLLTSGILMALPGRR